MVEDVKLKEPDSTHWVFIYSSVLHISPLEEKKKRKKRKVTKQTTTKKLVESMGQSLEAVIGKKCVTTYNNNLV